MKIALVAPHIFMQNQILPHVIFSPGNLVIDLANELTNLNHEVTLFSPGKVKTLAKNKTADLSLFEAELKIRGDNYLDLLKKHPLTFISLARQVQAELIADAYSQANAGQFDIVHIYMNEEEIGLPFTKLCHKPVAYTHHDPFSFLVKYRSLFPKYKNLNWLSMSLAQRSEMPKDTNWVGNIYHGLSPKLFSPVNSPSCDYFLFMGRIIEPKGLHLAIAAVKKYNQETNQKLKLKIAGKHYTGKKDGYWQTLQPLIDNKEIEYVGFVKDLKQKNILLANACALIIPSLFNEPFGMVMIEALACSTPIVGLDSGAIPEIIKDGHNGYLVKKQSTENSTVEELCLALNKVSHINRQACRQDFENRFSLSKMTKGHIAVYQNLVKG